MLKGKEKEDNKRFNKDNARLLYESKDKNINQFFTKYRVLKQIEPLTR